MKTISFDFCVFNDFLEKFILIARIQVTYGALIMNLGIACPAYFMPGDLIISCTVLCKISQKYMKIAITLNSNNSISIDFNFLTILLRDSRGEFTASGTGKQRLESGEDNVGE